LVLLSGLAAGCGGADERGDVPASPTESGVVARVVDGDTLRLTDGHRIRLVQIDAPEVGSECYAERATGALEQLAGVGTRIELEADPTLDEADEHGRLLRYIRSGDDNVNLRLVELGAAAPYFFRGARGRYADELIVAAQRARDQSRGLWGACPGAALEPELGSRSGRP
jgi:micrococcal nuclease